MCVRSWRHAVGPNPCRRVDLYYEVRGDAVRPVLLIPGAYASNDQDLWMVLGLVT